MKKMLATRLLATASFFLLISTSARAADSDNDGLSDSWETSYGLDPGNPNDAQVDQDGDGLTAMQEYSETGTRPNQWDSDLDGLSDMMHWRLMGWWKFNQPLAPVSGGWESSNGVLLGYGPLHGTGAAYTMGTGLWDNALQNAVPNTTGADASAVVASTLSTGWSVSLWFNVFSASQAATVAERPLFSVSYLGASVGTPVIDFKLDSVDAGGNSILRAAAKWSAAYSVLPLAMDTPLGWHHLTASADMVEGLVDVWVDGKWAGSLACEPLSGTATASLFVASHVQGAPTAVSYPLYGAVDDFRFYQRPLSFAESQTLYQTGLLAPSGGAAKHWTLASLLNSILGQQDADGDGYTNLTEVVAGSNPQLSSSIPQLVGGTFEMRTRLY